MLSQNKTNFVYYPRYNLFFEVEAPGQLNELLLQELLKKENADEIRKQELEKKYPGHLVYKIGDCWAVKRIDDN